MNLDEKIEKIFAGLEQHENCLRCGVDVFYDYNRHASNCPVGKSINRATKELKQLFIQEAKACLPEKKTGEPMQIPCPDGMEGCLVMHWSSDTFITPEARAWNKAISQAEQNINKLFEEGKK